MRFGLIEIVTIIAAIGIVAAVVIPRLSHSTERHDLPPAVQKLEDKGANFIYNETTGRLHLLNGSTTSEGRREAWITPDLTGAGGYVVQGDYITVVGEPRHSTSWYCFDGIKLIAFEESEELYVCGEE